MLRAALNFGAAWHRPHSGQTHALAHVWLDESWRVHPERLEWSAVPGRIRLKRAPERLPEDYAMPDAFKFGFVPFARPRGVLVVFCEENLKFGPATQQALAPLGDLVRRAAAADRFTGKNGSSLDIVAPAGLNVPRLVVVGAGKESRARDRAISSNSAASPWEKCRPPRPSATIFAEFGSGRAQGAIRSPDLALGARLRAYTFDRYKTKRKDGEERRRQGRSQFRLRQSGRGGEGLGAERRRSPTASCLARDLVNEPRERALSGRIRAPRRRACASSASGSKCSTSRR